MPKVRKDTPTLGAQNRNHTRTFLAVALAVAAIIAAPFIWQARHDAIVRALAHELPDLDRTYIPSIRRAAQPRAGEAESFPPPTNPQTPAAVPPRQARAEAAPNPPQAASGPRTVTDIPFVGDETSILEIKADPRKFLWQPIVICGIVTVQNYYNFEYTDASSTHFSLAFIELTKGLKQGESFTVYARRDLAGPLVSKILQVQKDAPRSRQPARLSVVITTRSFSPDASFCNDAELMDWQFPDAARTGWDESPRQRAAAARRLAAEEAGAQARAQATLRAAAATQAALARKLEWDKDLAAKNDYYGLFRMGERYRDGEGVEKDFAKAREYFTKAIAAGSDSAKAALDKLPKQP